MISGISSTMAAASAYKTDRTETKLTDEQKKTLTDILSKYDASSMTEETTKTMMDEIKSTGIKPSKEFGQLMEASGFKRPEKPQGPPPDGGKGGAEGLSSTDKSNLPSFMLDFISKQESGTVTQDDINTLISNLQSNSDNTKGSLVNLYA